MTMRKLSSRTPSLASTKLLKALSCNVRTACAVAALAMLGATSAQAVPVTYTFRTDMVGSMDGVAVSGPLTITALGDTDNKVLSASGRSYDITDLSVTFNLAGYGTFAASPGVDFAIKSFYIPGDVSFWMGPNAAMHLENDGSSAYDMSTDMSGGPYSYTWSDNYQGLISTSAGMFQINNSNAPITFQAEVGSAAAVPEPDSLALFGGAGAALLLASRCRKQARQATA